MAVEKICGIYKITSPTGSVYIGQSINIYKRKKAYSVKDCSKQRLLYNSIIKYGWEAHTFEVIEELAEQKLLNEREAYWISFYKTNKIRYKKSKGLNLTDGGDGLVGHKWS